MNRKNMKLDNEYGLNERKKGNGIDKIVITIILILFITIGVPVIFLSYVFISSDVKLNQEKETARKQAEQIATIKLKEKYPNRNFEIIGYNIPVAGNWSKTVQGYVYFTIKENNDEYNVEVYLKNETISDNIQEKENVKNLAEQIAIAKLKEKYPERNFEITDIIVTNSVQLTLKEDRVIVYVKDNNEKYTVIVNCKYGEISDNIQANEITKAIKERLNEIIKIDSDTIEFDVWKYENYTNNDKFLCFHNKYNGDIMDFLYNENHENEDYSYLYKMGICILYRNGKEHFYINKNNDEFLQLFNNVLLIDYKYIRPSYKLELVFDYDNYEYSFMQEEKRKLQQSVNEFYVYDENIHNFKKILE